MMLDNILTWTEWAAIIGATTGIAALLIQFFQYINIKPKLKIDITPECCILRDEFKIENKGDTRNGASYRPATFVVITNIGQMAATILSIEVQARSHSFIHRNIMKFLGSKKKREIIMSSSEKIIIEQTSKVPTVIESGHSWLAIMDTNTFRKQMKTTPYIFLNLKSSYKQRPIKKRIRLNP